MRCKKDLAPRETLQGKNISINFHYFITAPYVPNTYIKNVEKISACKDSARNAIRRNC